MIFGPDVSDFQGVVDWRSVRASGRLFGFTKASEGRTFVASTLQANRSGMAGAGLVLRGLYHFARPDRNLAVDEADHFLATVGPLAAGEVAVLDLEVGNIGHLETGAWALAWLEAVERATGRLPWLYSYAPFLAGFDTSALTRFPLWIAGYGRNDGQVPDDSFRPGTDRWARAVVWQYTSAATAPGIDGHCDDNLFEGTEAELAALAGGATTDTHLDGWSEIDRFLVQEGVAINRPPEEWQTTGGTHAATSWHYAGRARDYSTGMGCDEAAVVKALLPFAVPGGPIIELFHAATGTWLSDGAYANVGGHDDHAHAAIRPGAVLPLRTPPTPIPEEPEVAKSIVPLTVESGTRRRFPLPDIAGGFGWTKVSVTYASTGVDVRRAVIGPNERPMAHLAPEGVASSHQFDGRWYEDIVDGEEWFEVELGPGDGTLELFVEASDG